MNFVKGHNANLEYVSDMAVDVISTSERSTTAKQFNSIAGDDFHSVCSAGTELSFLYGFLSQ